MRTRNTVTAILMFVLVLSFTIGGTLAWLTDTTEPVTNTFTYGDINITLAETTEVYKMVPGNSISKDPSVTVESGSEACWLFVKVEESANFKDFMTYTIASDWTQLAGVNGVYYREVNAVTEDTKFDVLANNQVQVSDTVTKEALTALTPRPRTPPSPSPPTRCRGTTSKPLSRPGRLRIRSLPTRLRTRAHNAKDKDPEAKNTNIMKERDCKA